MNHIKIIEYEVLLNLIKAATHGRELAKKMCIPLTTLQRHLKELEKKNIICFKTEGKNKVYSIKKNLKSKKFVGNAENYKLIKTLEKYKQLEPIFEELLRKAQAKLIILFGSYAKDIPKEKSDIDIYIETKNPKIKKELELINTRLSIKTGGFNQKSNLIKEIIKNHVILKGVEEYYEKIGLFE